MEMIPTEKFLIKMIEDGEVYQVWTAYHPELGMPSYAVYNKLTDIIEHYQPNYVNALNIRDEFIQWYTAKQKGDNTLAVAEEFGSIDGHQH